MSDEPRRKRKWDNQGEADAAVKKVASDVDVYSREGSEISGTSSNNAGQDVAAEHVVADAAAAIEAAKRTALLVAQGKASSQVDVASPTSAKPIEGQPDSVAEPSNGSHGYLNSVVPIKESKERDEFVADIDINDLKNLQILTKGSVQTQLQRDTGADVTTRGRYFKDRSEATEKDPPLYLHVTAMTQEVLDAAVQKINELIEEAENQVSLPPQREMFQPGSRMDRGPPRHQSYHARVAIGIESDRIFNVRAKIVGPGGQFVKHVQNETRTRVQLKGHGSGYLEVETGRESDEPLYINILGNSQEDLDEAERLCKDLVETVRAEYERMKSRPPMQEPYGHSRQYGGRSNYHQDRNQRYQGGHHQYQQQPQQHPPPHQYGYNYNQQYQAHPPPPPGATALPLNPPLPAGPPPPSADHAAPGASAPDSNAAAAPGDLAAAADPSAQAYTYEQYEAYNQYYYQQQYYQQYGQYYQQPYAQPGVDQGYTTGASAAGVTASSDPALAYYGYAYAAPSIETATAMPSASTDGSSAALPPPPPPSADGTDASAQATSTEDISSTAAGEETAAAPEH